MLERVIVRNFRTIRELDWRPQKLNVLVGPNNSGKTNLCYALRFLSLAAQMDNVDDAAREACGAPNELVCRFSKEKEIHLEVHARIPHRDGSDGLFRYALTLEAQSPSEALGPALLVASERLERTDRPDWPPIINREGSEFRFCHVPRSDGSELTENARILEGEETALSEFRTILAYPELVEFVRLLLDARYHQISVASLRAQARIGNDPILAPDGSNLGSVLYTLKTQDEGTYRELLDLVREIEPRLEYFDCIPLGDNTTVTEAQFTGVDETMTTFALSDGTILYLALCTVALQSRIKMRREFKRPRLIMYEEPENGLYARHFGKLVERLEELSEHTQVIITTHNPFLLDYFDDRPESIFVLDMPDEETGTVIRSPDPKVVDELLEQMSMGEMLFREVLACE